MSKILECFAPDVTENMVNGFIRAEENFQKFNTLFHGDGVVKLFIHYQPKSVTTEVRRYTRI